MIDQFMETNSWTISERLTLPGREGDYFPSDDLQLHLESVNFLKSSFPAGIYRHQKEAIQSSLAGDNICITTGTASGKSLPFYVAAMEKLAADQKARIIVVYPLADIFRNPQQLLGMPLSEGALYLENSRVQYIHAMCLARHGGEHDRVCSFLCIKESPEFKSAIPWAKGFLELCRSERIGEILPEFQAMKAQTGEDPNHTFPLRDVEIQFQVKQKRGPNETPCLYPLDPMGNIYFDFPRFTRNFFTTGVTFTHPAMRRPNVKNEVIAQILFEVFLMVLPVERRDIHFAADRYRVEREPIAEGARFVAIYDQTYGSLRLSARIMEERTIHGILEKMAVIMKLLWEDGSLEEDSETAAALGEILACLGETSEIITIGATPSPAETVGRLVRVILPGSKGLNLRSNNGEFFVENVFYSPNYNGLAYRGYGCEGAIGVTHDVKTIVALASLLEIPGESKIGWYDPESGELNNEPVRLN